MAQEKTRKTISEEDAQHCFGEVVKRACTNQERVVVERDGVPVVVILSFTDYEQLIQEIKLTRFAQLSREAGLDAERAGLTEEQLEQEMEAIRMRSHQKTYE